MKSIFLSLIASLGALTPLASAQNCDKFETDLIAGQHIAAGEVNVTNSGSHLRIGIRPEHGWLLEEVHIYAGLDPVPLNGGGRPSPGQFPYKTDYDPPAGRHVEMIPLADLGTQCGDHLYLAVHCAVVKLDRHGNVIASETAWAFGTPFNKGWGWFFEYDLCCCNGQPPIDLSVGPLQIGRPADFLVTGAQAGDQVYFFVNRGLIQCDAGPALRPFGGLKLDLIAPVYRMGIVDANRLGEAALQVRVPNRPELVGSYLGFQAAVAAGGSSVKSEALHAIVQ